MKNLILFSFILVLISCGQQEKATSTASNQNTTSATPWWADASIYEVNVRNYTPEGTFSAFANKLDQLEDLGVEILWLMPIHAIGDKNRKGSLGSYYAVKDYRSVNPEFGTHEDFKALVDDAHSRGMKVILDWVANHTAWDHPWVEAHPTWYSADAKGERPTVPFNENGEPTDWTDVADLDYTNEEMRKAMTEDMAYWIKEYNVDGFRCDVAHWVPVDFWKSTIASLKAIQPDVFMLAESDYPPNVNEGDFHMDYGWDMHHRMNQVAQKKDDVASICRRVDSIKQLYKPGSIKLNFITNHDENSWNGTIEERMGDAGDAMAVLAFTLPGMPLIYSGQEVGLNKRLAFFDKDEIDWNTNDKRDFYKGLIDLKSDNKSLWNGEYGSDMNAVNCGGGFMAYSRGDDEDRVWVALNFSEADHSFEIPSEFSFESVYMQHPEVSESENSWILPPNGYLILTK